MSSCPALIVYEYVYRFAEYVYGFIALLPITDSPVGTPHHTPGQVDRGVRPLAEPCARARGLRTCGRGVQDCPQATRWAPL